MALTQTPGLLLEQHPFTRDDDDVYNANMDKIDTGVGKIDSMTSELGLTIPVTAINIGTSVVIPGLSVSFTMPGRPVRVIMRGHVSYQNLSIGADANVGIRVALVDFDNLGVSLATAADTVLLRTGTTGVQAVHAFATQANIEKAAGVAVNILAYAWLVGAAASWAGAVSSVTTGTGPLEMIAEFA